MRSESVAIHKDYTGPHSVMAVVCKQKKKQGKGEERRGAGLGGIRLRMSDVAALALLGKDRSSEEQFSLWL